MSRSHLLEDELSRFLGRFDPVRQMRREIGKQWRFSREIRPTPPIALVGGGSGNEQLCLTSALFLALRQLHGLAERGVAVPVCCGCVLCRGVDIILSWVVIYSLQESLLRP